MSRFRILGAPLEAIGICLVVLILALLLVALAANAIFVTATNVSLNRRLEEIARAGDPVALEDLVRKPIPDSQNAAFFLRQAKGDIETAEKRLMPIYDSPEYDQAALTPAQLAEVAAILDSYPNVMPLLRRAAVAPDYDLQIDVSKGLEQLLNESEVNYKRAVTRHLKWQSLVLLDQGKFDEALEPCLLILQLASHFDRDPAQVNFLVSLAIRGEAISMINRVLRTGEISEQSRAALDEELAKHDSHAAHLWCIKSERVFGIAAFNDTIPWRKVWFTRGMGNRELSYYLDMMQQQIDNVGRLPREVQPIFPTGQHPLTDMLIPAFQSVYDAQMRTIACVRSLRVLNALQRSPEKKTLAELKLPTQMTMDPFSGEPLIIKFTQDGPIIYSVGRNQKDDGGKLGDELKDIGVGPLTPVAEAADSSSR